MGDVGDYWREAKLYRRDRKMRPAVNRCVCGHLRSHHEFGRCEGHDVSGLSCLCVAFDADVHDG
jgi:hypothetical protein